MSAHAPMEQWEPKLRHPSNKSGLCYNRRRPGFLAEDSHPTCAAPGNISLNCHIQLPSPSSLCSLSEPLYPKRWKGPALAFGKIASEPTVSMLKSLDRNRGWGSTQYLIVNDCYTRFWIKVAVWYFQSFAFPEPMEMGLGKHKESPAREQGWLLGNSDSGLVSQGRRRPPLQKSL